MKLDFIAEVWDALRDHIDLNDRGDAADTLINLLIDHNYEADDIKDSFKDRDINKALKYYADQQDEEDEEDEENDEDDEADNDW